MKVRILSGNGRGQIVEMDQTEGEINIGTGFAELYISEPLEVVHKPVLEIVEELPEDFEAPLKRRR